jgi:hypothetical protein
VASVFRFATQENIVGSYGTLRPSEGMEVSDQAIGRRIPTTAGLVGFMVDKVFWFLLPILIEPDAQNLSVIFVDYNRLIGVADVPVSLNCMKLRRKFAVRVYLCVLKLFLVRLSFQVWKIRKWLQMLQEHSDSNPLLLTE